MWLLLLKRLWPFLAVAGLLLGAWLWHVAQVHKADAAGYERAKDLYTVALAKQREAHIAERTKQAEAWQRELVEIQSRSITVLPAPVRLCVSPPSLPGADPAPSAADASVGPGHAVSPGIDLGPALRAYGAECERYRRALKAAQL